jgi:uncharacterized protein YdbL (DUF1318 family)
MRNRATFLPFVILILAVMACVTINVYFPEARIEEISEKIESEVRKEAEEEQNQEEQQEPQESETTSSSSSLLDVLLGATPAMAQEVPSPEVTNPAIRQIIDSRAGRFPKLVPFFDSGAIGENNKGLVESLHLDEIDDLRQRAEVQKLVKAENADRNKLYQEIAAAENVDSSQLARIGETYAETMRKKARSGWWIQTPDGEWKQK